MTFCSQSASGFFFQSTKYIVLKVWSLVSFFMCCIRRCNLKIPNKAKRSAKYVTALRRNQCFSLRFLVAANWLTKELHWSAVNAGFFSTFSRKLNGQKNSIFALSEKTQGHFWPKTQSWGSFYLMNKEEKTQIFVKRLSGPRQCNN